MCNWCSWCHFHSARGASWKIPLCFSHTAQTKCHLVKKKKKKALPFGILTPKKRCLFHCFDRFHMTGEIQLPLQWPVLFAQWKHGSSLPFNELLTVASADGNELWPVFTRWNSLEREILMRSVVCVRARSVFLLCRFSFFFLSSFFSSQPSAFSSGDPFRSGSPKTKDSGTWSFSTGQQFPICVTVEFVYSK